MRRKVGLGIGGRYVCGEGDLGEGKTSLGREEKVGEGREGGKVVRVRGKLGLWRGRFRSGGEWEM